MEEIINDLTTERRVYHIRDDFPIKKIPKSFSFRDSSGILCRYKRKRESIRKDPRHEGFVEVVYYRVHDKNP